MVLMPDNIRDECKAVGVLEEAERLWNCYMSIPVVGAHLFTFSLAGVVSLKLVENAKAGEYGSRDGTTAATQLHR